MPEEVGARSVEEAEEVGVVVAGEGRMRHSLPEAKVAGHGMPGKLTV